jgi:hypothetical protein
MKNGHETALDRIGIKQIAIAGVIAALISLAGNWLVIALTIGFYDIPSAFAPLHIDRVTIFTILGVAGATGVFAFLARNRYDPTRLYWIISAIVLVLSFIPDIAMLFTDFIQGATIPGVVSLIVMHIIAAAASVSMMTWVTREKTRRYDVSMAYE